MKIKKIEEINIKKKHLDNVKVELKKCFVGIDDVIDQFISSVESWYLYPELRTKPLVINLWGITGVGKTALVRKFVELIEYKKNYCELEAESADAYMLKDTLYDSMIDHESHAIMLIDEFQKLKTINEKSEEVDSTTMVDLWSFLSDGSFPVDYNLQRQLQNFLTDLNSSSKKSRQLLDSFDYGRFKSFIKGNIKDYKKYMNHNVTIETAKKIIEKMISSEMTYMNKVFSKMLIIISGNLDEAFYFSGDVFDADTDADIYNEMSNDIKITNIKRSLLMRFRPEQIARLGNIHIIYPVLSRSSYEKLIKITVDEFVNKVSNEYDIKINIDDSIYKVIYENGVFPTQGTRPVFSTISLFVESPLSNIIGQIALKYGDSVDSIKELNIYFSDSCIKCNIFDTEFSCKVSETLNTIRSKKSEQNKVAHAVHEAGHAVIQAVLYSVAPRQLTSASSQPGVGGFCTVYPTSGSKDQFKSNMMISLGGRAAEEIVFGEDSITFGAGSDLFNVTNTIKSYVYEYAFDENQCVHNELALEENKEGDDRCEHLVKDLYKNTKKTLVDNKQFFIAIADELIKNEFITSDRFIEIGNEYGYNLSIKKNSESIDEDFIQKFENFKK